MKELKIWNPQGIFKTISRRVSEVRKDSESGFERADALRVRVFA